MVICRMYVYMFSFNILSSYFDIRYKKPKWATIYKIRV